MSQNDIQNMMASTSSNTKNTYINNLTNLSDPNTQQQISSSDYNQRHNQQPLTTNIINIATTNIRGLCEDTKREIWFNIWDTYKWDIIITTETNSKDFMTKFWKKAAYECTWTSDNQNIGSGIGIALKTDLAQRIIHKEYIDGRAIKIDLAFPQKKYLRIIGVYSPAKLPERRKFEIKITKWLNKLQNDNWETILAGDLNEVHKPAIDKESSQPKKFNNKWATSSILINKMHDENMYDSFRQSHPSIKHFTWSNSRGSRSRLDQIWLTQKGYLEIENAHILDPLEDLYHSDHNILTTNISINFPTINTRAKLRKVPNHRYNWARTSEDKWKKWSEEIKLHCEKHTQDPSYLDTNLDRKWYKFREAILMSTKKHIKKFKKRQINNRNKEAQLNKANPILIISLAQLKHKIEKYLNNNGINSNLTDIQIATRNLDIITEPVTWSLSEIQILLMETKNLLKMHKKDFKTNTGNMKRKAIQKAIKERNNWLESNKKKMINSFFDQGRKTIKIDKIITPGECPILITDPVIVKNKVKEHFQSWTEAHSNTEITTDWVD
jgi:exonuclease III